MLLLPLIDSSDTDPKSQLSRDPLTVRDKPALTYYSTKRLVVDKVSLAYATLSALGKQHSKATLLGYQSARGAAINASANCIYTDRMGISYTSYKDIPKHTRDFLRKLLNYRKIQGDPESESESESEDEEVPQNEGATEATE